MMKLMLAAAVAFTGIAGASPVAAQSYEDVREYWKDRREAEREYRKDREEARREYAKQRREAEREYWKEVREARKERREAFRDRDRYDDDWWDD